jgi:hypothetical protein
MKIVDIFQVPADVWLECAYARAMTLDGYCNIEQADHATSHGVCNTLDRILSEFGLIGDGYHIIRSATPEVYPFWCDGEGQDESQEARLLFCLFMHSMMQDPNDESYFDFGAINYSLQSN